MKVYLVDDEPLMVEMLVDAIGEAYPKISPCTFTSSKKLLEKVKEDAPDVVFMDIKMPGIDGLSLAEKIKEIAPNTNLIFVTGYSEYTLEAFKLFASGYVMKPVEAKDIVEVMSNLRYKPAENEVSVKTFGNFSVSVDGKPIKFRLQKSMELLAYLIDRKGAAINKKEIAAVVFDSDDYSRNIQAEITRVARWLEEDLTEAGAERIFRRDTGMYSINENEFSCDLYDFLSGKDIPFLGEYMEQYTWAEYRKEKLEEMQ